MLSGATADSRWGLCGGQVSNGHTCALTNSGVAYCWGNTSAGSSGTGWAERALLARARLNAHVIPLTFAHSERPATEERSSFNA
jgi:hypothetical protein